MTEAAASAKDWISAPGDTIGDLLDERKWPRSDFAKRLGVTSKHVNELLHGRATITPETARKLSTVLGSTPQFWLTREAQYRALIAQREAEDEFANQSGWLSELPVSWMTKQRWLPSHGPKAARVRALLGWFGVASVQAWRERWATPLTAFRASDKFQKRLGAVATWLCAAEREASEISCEAFEHERFQRALGEIRPLASESDPGVFVPKLRNLCAKCGVAVVFVPAPPGCPVSGATRWLAPDKALLALSLRYKSNDQLWFSFFHEAGHIIKHGKKLLFIEGIDGLDPTKEAEANRFAADTLIPPREATRLRGLRSEVQVRQVARELRIAPGIVVGRMQYEEWLPRSHLNHLKVRYTWAEAGISALRPLPSIS